MHHKDVSVDQNVVSVDDVAIKDTSKNEATTSKLVNPTGQRSLKVRIKVGSYTPAIKKDEIYSGLGLLTPSSTSNNSEDSSDSQIESHDMFDSAGSILRVSLIMCILLLFCCVCIIIYVNFCFLLPCCRIRVPSLSLETGCSHH